MMRTVSLQKGSRYFNGGIGLAFLAFIFIGCATSPVSRAQSDQLKTVYIHSPDSVGLHNLYESVLKDAGFVPASKEHAKYVAQIYKSERQENCGNTVQGRIVLLQGERVLLDRSSRSSCFRLPENKDAQVVLVLLGMKEAISRDRKRYVQALTAVS